MGNLQSRDTTVDYREQRVFMNNKTVDDDGQRENTMDAMVSQSNFYLKS